MGDTAIHHIGDEVSDEIRAVLIADIHQLRSELAVIGERIEALGPTINDVDDKWLLSKKKMLTTEFQEIMKQSLAEESRSALSETNRILSKASNSMNVAFTQLVNANTRLLVMACFVGLTTGICSAIITWFLILYL